MSLRVNTNKYSVIEYVVATIHIALDELWWNTFRYPV